MRNAEFDMNEVLERSIGVVEFWYASRPDFKARVVETLNGVGEVCKEKLAEGERYTLRDGLSAIMSREDLEDPLKIAVVTTLVRGALRGSGECIPPGLEVSIGYMIRNRDRLGLDAADVLFNREGGQRHSKPVSAWGEYQDKNI